MKQWMKLASPFAGEDEAVDEANEAGAGCQSARNSRPPLLHRVGRANINACLRARGKQRSGQGLFCEMLAGDGGV